MNDLKHDTATGIYPLMEGYREDLTPSQRAMGVAHPLAFAYFQKEAKRRNTRAEGGRSKATVLACRAQKVGSATVGRARIVHLHGSEELKAAVYAGRIPVNVGYRLAKNSPKIEQTEVLNKGTEQAIEKSKLFGDRFQKGRKKGRKKGLPPLAGSIIRDINRLIRIVRQSPIGLSTQRERSIRDLETSRLRIREAMPFLQSTGASNG